MIDDRNLILHDIVRDSTHQRLELLAVINSLDYIVSNNIAFENIAVYTDSQYVVGLQSRLEKLKKAKFLTKKSELIVNADLLNLLDIHLGTLPVQIFKVKAHLKETTAINYNRKIDKLVRSLVRNAD